VRHSRAQPGGTSILSRQQVGGRGPAPSKIFTTRSAPSSQVPALWAGRYHRTGQDVHRADRTGAVIGSGEARDAVEVPPSRHGALSGRAEHLDGARADEFFANLFGYRRQRIGDGRDMDYTIPAAQARRWLPRGSPWMSGASSTWFAHTRSWIGGSTSQTF
jgi:hypothetical protein